ncbi:MAG: hypothetical protein ACE5HB_09135, partial [Terriglobia bacterium]
MADNGKTTANQPAQDTAGRNRLLLVAGTSIALYLLAITAQALLAAPGLLGPERGSWGVWVVAPLIAAAVAGRFMLAWLRCRAASKGLRKERDLLLDHVRELTYNINNPLNSITANLVALKTEFNPGSVEQIETSSKMISKIVMKLSNIDLVALKAAEQAQGGEGMNVEEMGR